MFCSHARKRPHDLVDTLLTPYLPLDEHPAVTFDVLRAIARAVFVALWFGEEVSLPMMTMYRFSDGKVQKDWELSDRLGMLQQLGVIP